MGKIIFTIALCSICLFATAQVRLVDTSEYDSILVLKGTVGVEHLIGVQKPATQNGGLKVFIENAEENEILGATVQVMDGERQVTGAVADFTGFAYIPDIDAGVYTIVIRHIHIGEARFQVTIESNLIYELREELQVCADCPPPVFIKRNLRAWDFEPQEDVFNNGLKVFIENAEQDDIIGATVQVMDGDRQVTGGVTDFMGFLYLPNIDPGAYVVIIRHINVGTAKFQVTIKENQIYELREKIETGNVLIECFIGHSEPIFEDPYMTSYRTEDILRSPSVMRN